MTIFDVDHEKRHIHLWTKKKYRSVILEIIVMDHADLSERILFNHHFRREMEK